MRTIKQNEPSERPTRITRAKESRNKVNFFFCLISLLWAIVLLVFTTSTNFDGLFHFQIPQFDWNPNPDFNEMFNFSDFNIVHTRYLNVKLGHFLGFAFMEYVIYCSFGNKKNAIFLTILFAISTEILQIVTFRDGRIYDMIIDSAGAWLSYKFNFSRK